MKRTSILFMMMAVCLLLTSCMGPGVEDWEYKLPNGYKLIRVNGNDIALFCPDGIDNSPEGVFVNEFCTNDRFVCLKMVLNESPRENELGSTYYIIDTVSHTHSGPYLDENEFRDALETLEVGKLGSWQATVPAPTGANFD